MSDDPKLAEAVYETINKRLDSPKYQRLFVAAPLDKRLWRALRSLGYTSRDSYIHPKAKQYYRKYGEQYVQCLEAAIRLSV